VGAIVSLKRLKLVVKFCVLVSTSVSLGMINYILISVVRVVMYF